MAASHVRIGERLVLLIILGIAALAYAGAILLVALRKTNHRLDSSGRPLVRLMPDRHSSSAVEPLYVIADLFDPSLISLPSSHGFSRQLWSREIPVRARQTEWNPNPSFLDSTAPRNLNLLLDQEPLLEAVQSSAEKPRVEPETIPNDVALEAVGLPKTSIIRTAGPISTRRILSQPILSPMSPTAPLRPTRLRIAIAADGTLHYAMLERSCGDDAVDARAMELAHEFRFDIQFRSELNALEWGTLEFLWAATTKPE